MCTAVNTKNFFGRNLDYEKNFGQEIVVSPRNFEFDFRHNKKSTSHPLIIGMAKVIDGVPLYFDAMNEYGLAVAGLNFEDNAVYNKKSDEKINISSFEFISYILTNAESVSGVRKILANANITDDTFDSCTPYSPLHWIISDSSESITAESVKEGLKVYDNKIGVLTNNPEFPFHLSYVTMFSNVSSKPLHSDFKPFSRGMSGIGLPGDMSSPSRFVRASFIKQNSLSDSLSQFFHMLSSVEQIEGAVEVREGKLEKTLYSSAIERKTLTYYYTTYSNRRINAVTAKSPDSNALERYKLKEKEDISFN